MHRDDIVYPFTAVVGQDQVKLSLLLNAVTHEVGGVLIRGHRGTAKSTLARAAAYLLPEIDTVAGCPFSCDPSDIESLCDYCSDALAVDGSFQSCRTRMKIVTLPLNATEEMIVGTLDIEKALRNGEKRFEPGILARANRSILYVDEVNLLEDHLVDTLLDSSAMGVNIVEREGISFRHSARFILVGTMNPEEGDLRPQLEDRFGLCAEVDAEVVGSDRVEIIRRNLEFGRNPVEFESRWHGAQESLRGRLVAARQAYPAVAAPDEVIEVAARLSERAGADGHRADLSMLQASRALAALEGVPQVGIAHLERVAGLALNHRVRKGLLGVVGEQKLDIPLMLREVQKPAQAAVADTTVPAPGEAAGVRRSRPSRGSVTRPRKPDEPETAFDKAGLPEGKVAAPAPGKRGRPKAPDKRGRYYRSTVPTNKQRKPGGGDVAVDATIRAMAARCSEPESARDIIPDDIRVKLRKRKCGASILFVVDASASMGAMQRLEAARQAILTLLVEAYQKRDRVGLIVFKDDAAQLVMSPTSSKALATRLLSQLRPGGTTPLSHGLALGGKILERELSRNPQPFPVLVLISDGGGNVTLGSKDPMNEALDIARDIRGKGISSVILDSAPHAALGGRPSSAWRISDAMGGAYFAAHNLSGESIVDTLDRSIAREAMSLPRAAR